MRPAALLVALLFGAALAWRGAALEGSWDRVGDAVAALQAQYAQEWEMPMFWDCAVLRPPSDPSMGSSIGDSFATAVDEANASLTTAGEGQLEVIASYGLQLSIRAPPSVVAREQVQQSCHYIADATMSGTGELAFAANNKLDTRQGARAMMILRTLLANPWLNGTGIKIGILSDSYRRAQPGALSPCKSVNQAILLDDSFTLGNDEGRAMAELICFIAPEARLYFHTAAFGQAAFANGILRLKTAGVNVIVDDVVYFAEAIFSPGIIQQAVETVSWQGVSYFGAAGNGAGQSWEADATWVRNGTRTFHNFGPARVPEIFLAINLTGRTISRLTFLFLQWDEPFYRNTNGLAWPDSDIDLILCTAPTFTSTCFAGREDNNGNSTDPGRDAFEGIQNIPAALAPGSIYYVAIELIDTTRTTSAPRLKLYGDPRTATFSVVSGQLNNKAGASTVIPHVNTPAAIAVGAANYRQTPGYGVRPAVLEPFSSWGRAPMVFDSLGSPLSRPLLFTKPDIVGPDGMDTSFFGTDTDANGLPNFSGTSAAAPNVAAVAALMLQQQPGLRPAAVYDKMRATAKPMGAGTGWNRKSGYGFIGGDRLLPVGTPGGPCDGKRPGDPCDDGDACTINDTCKASGKCKGVPRTCENSTNDCIQSSGTCNPDIGICIFKPAPYGTPCRPTNSWGSCGTICDGSGGCFRPRYSGCGR